MSFPFAANEAERLRALRDLRILDTPPERQFDAVCRTAQALFAAPVAVVSLMDENRQWFKAKCGIGVEGTPREVAFCTYTILSDEVLVVEDATQDERFRGNPFVTGEPGIRFYAGAPLILRPGIRVGTLCLIDTVARTFSAEQRDQLQDLAMIVLAHLRLHEAQIISERETTKKAATEAFLRSVLDASSDCIKVIALDGTLAFMNANVRWRSTISPP